MKLQIQGWHLLFRKDLLTLLNMLKSYSFWQKIKQPIKFFLLENLSVHLTVLLYLITATRCVNDYVL